MIKSFTNLIMMLDNGLSVSGEEKRLILANKCDNSSTEWMVRINWIRRVKVGEI